MGQILDFIICFYLIVWKRRVFIKKKFYFQNKWAVITREIIEIEIFLAMSLKKKTGGGFLLGFFGGGSVGCFEDLDVTVKRKVAC